MTYARTLTTKHGWPGTQVRVDPPLGEFAAVAFGLAVAIGLLTMLAFDAGPSGTLVALVFFVLASTVTGRALYLHYPHQRLGLCNAITLMRLAMAAALVAPLLSNATPSWGIFAVAAIALSLDGIDGWFARRQGYVSDFGARFDMEVDSALALILAISAAVSSGLGPLAILLGLPRYAFVVAAWGLPWMRRDLPDRFSRKVVCVVQLGALIALQLPILPLSLAVLVVTVATLALIWSFAVDVRWLWRRRA